MLCSQAWDDPVAGFGFEFAAGEAIVEHGVAPAGSAGGSGEVRDDARGELVVEGGAFGSAYGHALEDDLPGQFGDLGLAEDGLITLGDGGDGSVDGVEAEFLPHAGGEIGCCLDGDQGVGEEGLQRVAEGIVGNDEVGRAAEGDGAGGGALGGDLDDDGEDTGGVADECGDRIEVLDAVLEHRHPGVGRDECAEPGLGGGDLLGFHADEEPVDRGERGWAGVDIGRPIDRRVTGDDDVEAVEGGVGAEEDRVVGGLDERCADRTADSSRAEDRDGGHEDAPDGLADSHPIEATWFVRWRGAAVD